MVDSGLPSEDVARLCSLVTEGDELTVATIRPTDAIRPVTRTDFCVAGPR
jgi:hypothetical protein